MRRRATATARSRSERGRDLSQNRTVRNITKHGGQNRKSTTFVPPTTYAWNTSETDSPRMPGSGVPLSPSWPYSKHNGSIHIPRPNHEREVEKEDAEIKDTAFLDRLPTVVPRVWSRPWRRGATKCRAKHSIGNARTGRGVSAGTALRCSVLRRSIDQKPCSCLHLARGEGRARPLRRP